MQVAEAAGAAASGIVVGCGCGDDDDRDDYDCAPLDQQCVGRRSMHERSPSLRRRLPQDPACSRRGSRSPIPRHLHLHQRPRTRNRSS